MKTPKISQSLMKNLEDYAEGKQCGLKFKAMYLEGKSMPPTEAMALGNWFEYIASGQLPRDGVVPEAVRLKSGKLSTKYLRMEKQAENYHNLLSAHGFDVISTGHTFKKNKKATGICDVIARKDGKSCIIDIKSSGMLDNKWEELGWGLDGLEYKSKIMIQAVHYTILAEEEFGEPIDFYFAVFSTTNDTDFILVKVIIEEDTIAQHIKDIDTTIDFLETADKTGYRPSSSYRECSKCFLNESCPEALKTAEINTKYYSNTKYYN